MMTTLRPPAVRSSLLLVVMAGGMAGWAYLQHLQTSSLLQPTPSNAPEHPKCEVMVGKPTEPPNTPDTANLEPENPHPIPAPMRRFAGRKYSRQGMPYPGESTTNFNISSSSNPVTQHVMNRVLVGLGNTKTGLKNNANATDWSKTENMLLKQHQQTDIVTAFQTLENINRKLMEVQP
ncbi:MAG: hypothetical protein HQL69_12255 [Magnetococcales bacterium]|nr:hypothetical protein [Magnetococcales bacterium]